MIKQGTLENCSKITSPYDGAFKQGMRNINVAREMFETYLPKVVLDNIDLSTLALSNSSYIDFKYTQTYSDILYKVDIKSDITDVFRYKVFIFII